MAEKQNIPEIRFEGFTDPWEQRKFGELYRPVSEKNDLTFGRDKIISVANMYFNSAVYVTEDSYLATYNVMRLGDIAFEGNRSKRFAHGRFVENTIGDGIVSHVFKVFRPVGNNYDLAYWKHAINNEKLMKDALTRSTKASTMMHELVSSDFLEESTLVPTLDEQRAIGIAIESIDNLITLHQRKYDKLCTVKKSMLDKMFPKPGETEPEIRFEGFTDPWEQRKFSDLTARASIQSSDSDLPQVEYEDIIPGEGTLNKDLSDKEGGKTGIKFYAGDVLYGKLRPYLMNWLYPQFNGVAVGDFWVLRATECDSSFLYRLVQTGSFQRLANVSSGSKMPRADWNLISQSFFAVPADRAEQKAIAKSLAELDNLITLHQRKFELLRNIKKSLLDRMFV